MEQNTHLIPEAAENKSGKLDPAIFARMAANPSMAEAAARLQNQMGDALAAIIDGMAANLPSELPSKKSGAQSMREIATASRHAAQDAQERRELAEAIILGALLNRDNPDWDPKRPETHKPNYQDPLVQLLQAKISGQQP